MRVAFDASSAAFPRKTGTGVYSQELILAYQKRFPEDTVIHTYRLSRRIRGRDHLLPMTPNARQETFLGPSDALKGLRYDVFHGLNCRLPILVKAKKIATVHDLFSIYGSFAPDEFREDQAKKLKQMIKRANHIIVPASYTKKQLVDKMGIIREKITVVAEGVRDIYLEKADKGQSLKRVKNKFRVSDDFLLSVGTLESRKNVTGIIKAFARISTKSASSPDLVLVGHEGFGYEKIQAEIEKSGLKSKTHLLGFLEEPDLRDLYASCKAFVYLSLEEGFGIPVIEAMACGAPVVSSNTTSLPEVGAGHTWLVDPLDVDQAVSAIRQVLTGGTNIQNQVAKGQKYALSRTWTKVAEETRKVYDHVLKR